MIKPKRGRPRKNGSVESREVATILVAYDKARQAGEKHHVAITAARAALLEKYPEIRLSETSIKRSLAKWQGRDCGATFRVSEISVEERRVTMPNGDTLRLSHHFSAGFRPIYQRHNAKGEPSPL